MAIIISPEKAAALAFEPCERFSTIEIPEATILSAEQKFLAPALGPLYGQLAEGLHPELLDEYLAPPLALWAKWLLLPTLAVQSGAMGVVQMRSDTFTPAAPLALSRARQRVKADARALMRRAIGHIEAHPERYPAYAPAPTARVVGNVVL